MGIAVPLPSFAIFHFVVLRPMQMCVFKPGDKRTVGHRPHEIKAIMMIVAKKTHNIVSGRKGLKLAQVPQKIGMKEMPKGEVFQCPERGRGAHTVPQRGS